MKTTVKHSEKNSAWNVVGTSLGRKYKIARVPYLTEGVSQGLAEIGRLEAKDHADFISRCFNNRAEIEVLVFGKRS